MIARRLLHGFVECLETDDPEEEEEEEELQQIQSQGMFIMIFICICNSNNTLQIIKKHILKQITVYSQNVRFVEKMATILDLCSAHVFVCCLFLFICLFAFLFFCLFCFLASQKKKKACLFI